MISFKSVENFFEECTTGIEFKYEEKWHLIEFDDLEALVHSYKIGNRTLAEIICDENNIPRSVLPIKRKIEKCCLT